METNIDSEIQIKETVNRKDIDEIEKIERKYYKPNALTVDILVPAANFLGFITVAKTYKKTTPYLLWSPQICIDVTNIIHFETTYGN